MVYPAVYVVIMGLKMSSWQLGWRSTMVLTVGHIYGEGELLFIFLSQEANDISLLPHQKCPQYSD